MTKKPFIQKGFKLFLAFIMFLGILFQNSHITFAERGTEVNRTENKSTENKSTENKSTENKSTENKSTENKSTENKSTAANGASDKGTEENLANLIKNKAAEVKGAEANKTKVTITRFEIKDKEGNPIPPGKKHGYWSKYRLEMDWDASMYKKGELKEGDYFVITLPKQFKFPTEGSAVHFPLYAPDKQTIVAWADVNSEGEAGGGTVKVTFTNYVNNRENIKGDMFLEATIAHKNINAGGSNKIIISIGGIQTSVDINIEPKPTLDNEVLGKWGEKITGNENQAQWRMRINHKKGHFSNLVIKDELFVSSGALPPGIHYIPETFELKEVEMNAYGEGQKVINTYNYEKLKQHITFSAKETKFEFRFSNMLGNTKGKQFILSYKSTYIPQLKLQNKAKFHSTEHNTNTESYWMNSQAGGGGQGDLTQKIKIFKVDENNDSIKLANAKFKVTKVADGSTFELTTNSQGEAVSEKLDPGDYLVKETEAPNGYVLDGKVYKVTVISGEALFLTVKNSKEIEISGEKTWDDNNDQDGKRPTKLTVILKKKVGGQTSEVKRQDVTPDSDGKWKYKFDKLPKYENGELIEYSVDEEKVDGYDKVTTRTTNGPDYNLKNTHKPEKRTIEGQKIWNDNNNQDGKRPTSIKVKLYKKVGNNNPEYVTEKVVTEGADKAWKWKFENLDKYENKQEIQYTVEEEAVGEGYVGIVTGSMAAGFKITNSRTPEVVNVQGTKTWDDANNQDGKRPEKITVELYKKVGDKQPEKVTTQEVKADKDGNWKYKFENLPKYEGGKEIKYSVKEVAVEGYTTEIKDFNITNKHVPEKTSVEGTKTWDDANNQDGKRPEKITVELYKKVGDKQPEKVTTQEVKADKDGNWKYKFENLPKYEGGKEIKYSVKEVAVEGYTTEIKDFNITNKHVPEKTSVEGTKTWDDANNQDGKRPEKITVELYKKVGDKQPEKVTTQEVKADKDGNWKYKFENLPKYEGGKEIKYSVKEVAVEGYTTEIKDFNITNKHVPEKTSVEGTKTWDDANNQDGKRPEKITVELYKKVGDKQPEKVTTQEVKADKDGNWKYKFENLPKYEGGKEIKYSVKEVAVEGYTTEIKDFNITNKHVPEKTSVEGTKTWDDANNQDGKRPEKITVELYKKVGDKQPEKVTTQEVKADKDGNWKYKFENLPKYEGGKEIKYSVKEVAVEGYTTEIKDFNITNKHVPEKTSVEGTKTWDDANNQDGKRPEKITVELYKKVGDKQPEKVTTQEVKADKDGNWKYKFENLPKYEGGKEIKYSVKEVAVEGYTTEIKDFNITNKHVPEKTSVEGTKTWDDANNQDGKRPEKITVELYKKVGDKQPEKVTTQEVKADKDGNWKYKFENLPKYEGGKEIKYSVKEVAVEGYTTEIKDFNITNKHVPEKTSVEGTKTWDDANNQDGKRPEKITVELYKKVGDKQPEKVTTQEVKADKDGNWKYKFENLPKYEGGKEIKYSVKEEPVKDYTTEINKVEKEDGTVEFNIINKHIPEKVLVSGTKTWIDNNNAAGKRPGSIKVILNKTVNGKTTKVAEKEVTEKDNWNYRFDNLPKYENGKVIKYSIDEVDVPGYKKSIKGYNLENKYIPPKPKLPKTGSAPSEVGGLGVLGLLAGYMLIRRKNKAN